MAKGCGPMDMKTKMAATKKPVKSLAELKAKAKKMMAKDTNVEEVATAKMPAAVARMKGKVVS